MVVKEVNKLFFIDLLSSFGMNKVSKEDGKDVFIFPYGYRRVSLPLYDVIFAISLGFIGPEINGMLKSLYNLDIDYRQIHTKIRKFWKRWDNALKLFFKPILQHLLKR